MIQPKTVYQYLLVILLGLLVFLFDYLELTNPTFNETLLFIISVAKSAYFVWFTFEKIRDSANHDFFFHEFVPFVALTILLIILSFGVDYYCLFRIRSDAFTGSITEGNGLQSVMTFIYFSVTTFTTAGLGEIVPHTPSARVFVMLELIIGYFFTILVIANITHIRESLSKKSGK